MEFFSQSEHFDFFGGWLKILAEIIHQRKKNAELPF
jgi:hypothetical protein